MPVPASMASVLADAENVLAAAPDGHLPLPYRRRIWCALGPLVLDGNRAVAGSGVRRRAALAIAAAEHVLPLWEGVRPGDSRPRAALALARQYLDGTADFRAAKRWQGKFLTDLDDLVAGEDSDPALRAGFAAAKAITTALHDELFEPAERDEDVSDEALDPDQWDAAYFAAMSFAGGAIWEDGSDPERRREFWQWYLKDAVPRAWDAVPE